MPNPVPWIEWDGSRDDHREEEDELGYHASASLEGRSIPALAARIQLAPTRCCSARHRSKGGGGCCFGQKMRLRFLSTREEFIYFLGIFENVATVSTIWHCELSETLLDLFLPQF